MKILAAVTVTLLIATLLFALRILHGSSALAMSPSDLLRHSLATMASIHDVHATGSLKEREVAVNDLDSTGSWRIQGDCASNRIATMSRFSIQGRQIGRHPKTVDELHAVRVMPYQGNSFFWQWRWTVWVRSSHPAGRWRLANADHDARLISSICPSLVVSQFFPVPSTFKNLGAIRVDGRTADHLQSAFNGDGSGLTVDLYVDQVTFRWVRVGLRGWGPGCCHTYSTTFDYSRYNVPVSIELPKPRTAKASSAWRQSHHSRSPS